MNKEIILYTMNDCQVCIDMYIELRRRGVEFKTLNLSEDEDKFNELVTDGFTILPLIECDGTFIEGFAPDLVEELFCKDVE